MVIVEGIKDPKNVLEALELLHTRVIDNIGGDSPLLEILENVMEGLDHIRFLKLSYNQAYRKIPNRT